MRIIGGEYGGRILKLPGHINARPTTDFAKEGLFNILQNKIDFTRCKVLDLFSGTGNISYEFASRGSKDITSVEMDKFHVGAIRKIVQEFSFSQIKVIHADVFRFIEKSNMQYDIIFADPPFTLSGINDLPRKILTKSILSNNGMFILEHSAQYNFSNSPGFRFTRNYGKIFFSFFDRLQ